MEPSNGSPEGSVFDILETLESKTTGKTERHKGYQNFTRLFEENEISLFADDVVKNIGRILSVIKKDIFSSSLDVNQCALHVLGVCLHDSEISRSMSMKASEDILSNLIDCIYKAEEKTTCTRALWCIGKQNLQAEVVRKQVRDIVEAVENCVERFGSISVTIEHESINTIARLAEQCPREMEGESLIWGKILLPMIVNPAVKVRERGLNVVESTLSLLKKHRAEIVQGVMPELKKRVLPELQKLFGNRHELYVLRCWGIIVQLFGEELHHTPCLNPILPIIQLGFVSPSPEVKIAAFHAWQYLIDNFATNSNVLGDPKRVKLIMQVFKINNAKVESIAHVKLKVWWHFVWMLGNKVTANFDVVVAPLLHFCLGGSKNNEQNGPNTPARLVLPNVTSPMTPKMNLTSSSSSSLYPQFPALQLSGCEALAHFLGSTHVVDSLGDYNFKLDVLRQDVVTGPSFFIKQSHLLITTAADMFISLGKDIPDSLLFYIWKCLVVHLKNAIESPIKLDIRDTLNTLLTRFQVIVVSQVLSSQTIMKMFQIICLLPVKVLGSSAYSIGENEMINGTPALFLAGLHLTPSLLQSCLGQEIFHTVFKAIMTSGVRNSSGALGFLDSLLELLNVNGKCVKDTETIWRLWSAIVHPLLEHVTETNEVNQGDSLEPNFGCCVKALTIPVELKLANMAQSTVKSLVKTWTDLYKTVNRLAAMVTNANANVICEELCHRITKLNKDTELKAETVDLQIQMCHVITTCLDYSSLGGQSTFNLGAAYSPRKASKKQKHPLENIHSLIALVCSLQKFTLEMVGHLEPKKSGPSLQLMLNNLVDIYSTLFTHVTSTGIISHLVGQLAQPMGMVFSESSKKPPAKVYNNIFLQKLEKLWMELCTCLQSRYNGIYDSELLSQLSPLLEACFLHTRKQIKAQTIAFWASTFGSAASLVYPESLRLVLQKVKEKYLMKLPGWVQTTTTTVIDETPISQMSQSQVPEPRIMGMPSPHKVHGSFLNKAVSPKVIKSPMKWPVTNHPVISPKKKVFKGLETSNDDEFVVIKASLKKKMVLTEHQREVMKERRVLPAMYNNLELSMDASLMSSHFATESQMESSNSTPTPTTDKVPLSLFGSALNTVSEPTKKTTEDKALPKPGPGGDAASDKIESDVSTPKSTKRKTRATSGMVSPDTESRSNDRRRQRGQARVKKEVESNSEDNEGSKVSEAESTLKQVDKDDIASEVRNESVIVIDESEPMDMETSQLILKPPEKQTAGCHIDLTKETQERPITLSEDMPTSVPQNFLGVVGFTQPSSGTSSDSTKIIDDDKPIESVDISGKSESKEDNLSIETSGVSKELDKDLSSSEPLFSWTQKLEALSQPQGNKRSPIKKSLSQDSKSPFKSGKSLHKSPRKQSKENNLGVKGALDKWLIKSPNSPVKHLGLDVGPPVNPEIIVQSVLSNTLVEETLSPTKFNKKDKLDKTNSPSIMETPTKTILEEIDVNHSQSNRKLFDSQNSNHEVDMIEDSNFVPASPTSKSVSIWGTPIVKMKRLSTSEINKFSPNNKHETSNPMTPSKDLESKSSPSLAKCIVNFDLKGTEGESSSHLHDDFSDLKPLENDTELSNVLSKSLTSTDQIMLKVDGKLLNASGEHKSVKVGEKMTGQDKSTAPISPTLFSQFTDNNGIQSNSELDVDSEDQSTQVLKKPEKQSDDNQEKGVVDKLEKQSIKSSSENDILITSQGFSTESKSGAEEGSSETVTETPRRGRKRKQITPKKMSPSDAKLQRKKLKNETVKEKNCDSRVKRKTSVRLKEKKLKKQNSQEHDNDISSDGEKSEEIAVEQSNVSVIVLGDKEKQMARKLDGSQPTNGELEEITTLKMTMSNETKVRKETDTTETSEDHKADNADVNTANTTDLKTDDHSNKNQNTQTDFTEINDSTDEDDLNHSILEKADKQVQLKVDKIQAETTPKSRNTPKMPERQSTTKRKKEVAQKMVLKSSQENRDELIMDTDSNLGGDEHFGTRDKDIARGEQGDTNSNDSKGKAVNESNDSETSEVKGNGKSVNAEILDVVKANLISSDTELMLECEKEDPSLNGSETSGDGIKQTDFTQETAEECSSPEKQTTKSLSDVSSSQSDEDLPLSQLKNKRNKRKSANNKLANKKDLDGQRSPISNKLRSNKVGTRLRSGQTKGKASPQSKKSVNLAIKRTRMKQKGSIEKDLQKSDDLSDTDEQANEPLMNIDNVEKEFEKETAKFMEELPVDTKDDNKLVSDSLQELFDSESLNEKNSVSESVVVKESANTNETPRKLFERSKQAGSMLMMNSDSKLVLGSRRFEKRKALARRSILKPSATSLSNQVGSPKRTDFHPIIVGQVYSPTASPSASILKKRRLLDVVETDTNSPPAKQRRVSFAEPLEEAGNMLTDMSNSLATLESESTNSTDKTATPLKQTGSQFTQSSSLQSSEGSISQGTYQSTQESQMNNSEPVCPALVDCEQSVEKILPQLTSSIWSRGLGQLIRARNIKTIGDLSSLSEMDILSLPIRAPKVETVRKTLSKFQALQTKSSRIRDSPSVRPEVKISTEEVPGLANQEEDPLKSCITETEKDKLDQNATRECSGSRKEELSIDKSVPSCSKTSFLKEMNELSQEFIKQMEAGIGQADLRTETIELLVEHNKQIGTHLFEKIKTLEKPALVEVLNIASPMLGAFNWKDT